MELKIQTEAEKKQNVGLMVKYPAEGKAGKDHKKLEKGQARQRSFLMSFLSEGLVPEDDLMEEDLKVGESSSQTQVKE